MSSGRRGETRLSTDTVAELHRDDQTQHDSRIRLWDEFNRTWLTALQRQHDLTEESLQSGRGLRDPRSLMSAETLERLAQELIRLCDGVERHGLVDYQMGVAEEQIIDRESPSSPDGLPPSSNMLTNHKSPAPLPRPHRTEQRAVQRNRLGRGCAARSIAMFFFSFRLTATSNGAHDETSHLSTLLRPGRTTSARTPPSPCTTSPDLQAAHTHPRVSGQGGTHPPTHSLHQWVTFCFVLSVFCCFSLPPIPCECDVRIWSRLPRICNDLVFDVFGTLEALMHACIEEEMGFCLGH